MACQVLLNLWTGLLLLLYKVCNKSWQTYHSARRTLDQMCLEFKSAKLPFSIYKSPLIFSTNLSNYSQSRVLPTLARHIGGNVMREFSCQASSSWAKTTFLVLLISLWVNVTEDKLNWLNAAGQQNYSPQIYTISENIHCSTVWKMYVNTHTYTHTEINFELSFLSSILPLSTLDSPKTSQLTKPSH